MELSSISAVNFPPKPFVTPIKYSRANAVPHINAPEQATPRTKPSIRSMIFTADSFINPSRSLMTIDNTIIATINNTITAITVESIIDIEDPISIAKSFVAVVSKPCILPSELTSPKPN